MKRFRIFIALLLALSALSSCSSSKKSPPSSADKLVGQGLQAQSAGNTALAIQDYQAAIQANQLDIVPYYDLGVIYQQRGDVADARTEYQKALLINPKYKSALFNLAILETPVSAIAAVSLYEQLNSSDPHDANVLLNLGLLLLKVGQTTQGRADLAEAVTLNPSFASRIPSTTATVPTTAPARPTSPTTA